MVRIKNLGTNGFIELIKNKKLFLFGAGKLTENCIDIYCHNIKVHAVIDNNPKLWGKQTKFKEQELLIINLDTFISIVEKENLDNIVLLIVPSTYVADIICQLDKTPKLDGLNCYIHAFIRNVKEESTEYNFTSGIPRIPKKIHYFWVGGNPLPNPLQRYIDTWKIFNPDYEIIRWDESNYDFTKNQYMKEAYEQKVWGFVPDYARLDIIYQYGGIYLDTDVEVIKNLDILLCDDAFFGMGSADRINLGVGFGSIAGNPLIKELRDYYNDRHFINPDGSSNKVPCYYYQHPIFKKYGFSVKNEYQKIDNNVLYPSEVLSPKGTGALGNFFSEKTLSIHHGNGSWANDREKQGLQKLDGLLRRIEQ